MTTTNIRRLAELLCERGLVHVQSVGIDFESACDIMIRSFAKRPPSSEPESFGNVVPRLFGRHPTIAEWSEIDREMLAYMREQARFRPPTSAALS